MLGSHEDKDVPMQRFIRQQRRGQTAPCGRRAGPPLQAKSFFCLCSSYLSPRYGRCLRVAERYDEITISLNVLEPSAPQRTFAFFGRGPEGGDEIEHDGR